MAAPSAVLDWKMLTERFVPGAPINEMGRLSALRVECYKIVVFNVINAVNNSLFTYINVNYSHFN